MGSNVIYLGVICWLKWPLLSEWPMSSPSSNNSLFFILFAWRGGPFSFWQEPTRSSFFSRILVHFFPFPKKPWGFFLRYVIKTCFNVDMCFDFLWCSFRKISEFDFENNSMQDCFAKHCMAILMIAYKEIWMIHAISALLNLFCNLVALFHSVI